MTGFGDSIGNCLGESAGQGTGTACRRVPWWKGGVHPIGDRGNM